MTQKIDRLVYYSRNRIDGPRVAIDAEISRILASARFNNQRNGVTGALLFNNGCFAQVLEGTTEALEETFERIQQDSRHGDVNLLAFGTAHSRSFNDWSMAYVGRFESERERFGKLIGGQSFDPAIMDAERLFQLLVDMVKADECVR